MNDCTHCGSDSSAGEFTLRTTFGEKDGRRFELMLCSDCLEAFRAENSIEILGE